MPRYQVSGVEGGCKAEWTPEQLLRAGTHLTPSTYLRGFSVSRDTPAHYHDQCGAYCGLRIPDKIDKRYMKCFVKQCLCEDGSAESDGTPHGVPIGVGATGADWR